MFYHTTGTKPLITLKLVRHCRTATVSEPQLLQQPTNGVGAGRRTVDDCTTERLYNCKKQWKRLLFCKRVSLIWSMDYTVSLQVQHQLTVFPTHLYQGYSLELQVPELNSFGVIYFVCCILYCLYN